MRRLALVAVLAVAACGEDSIGQPPGAPTTGVPTPAPPASTVASAVASTIESGDLPSSTIAPGSTIPSMPTLSGTSPPPAITVPLLSDVALVFASAGDDSAWLPVGWWTGSEWVSILNPSAETVVPSTSFTTLSVASVDLASPIRGVTDFARAQYDCVSQGPVESILYPLDLAAPEGWYGDRSVGVLGDWDVQPRAVAAVGRDAPEYQRAGEELVAADGVDPNGGDVTQVVRADLDGDGIEEVLYTFERQTDTIGTGAQGDFSYTIARFPSATGEVRQQAIFRHVVPDRAEVPFADTARGRVAAIADLNGDGVMEVAVATVYWEGAGMTVFELQGGSLEPVIKSSCGT